MFYSNGPVPALCGKSPWRASAWAETAVTRQAFARSVADAAWFGACLMGIDPRDEQLHARLAAVRSGRIQRAHGNAARRPGFFTDHGRIALCRLAGLGARLEDRRGGPAAY